MNFLRLVRNPRVQLIRNPIIHISISHRLIPQNLTPQKRIAMSTFMLDNNVQVNSVPDLTDEELLSFPAFKTWRATLEDSLAQQAQPSHPFCSNPYVLRKIDIQAVTRWHDRLGFINFTAEVSNSKGEKLPGSVFLRGGSVGMLLILRPNDIRDVTEDDKYAVLTIQPRVPAGSLAFAEIPAGMLDDSGTFAGAAAKEIKEETDLLVEEGDLIDMTALALPAEQESESGERLQQAVYPSPGGSDEFMPLFLCQKALPHKKILELQGKLTGLRDEGEKITLKLVPLKDLWKAGARDGKTLAAWALYQGLKQDGLISGGIEEERE